MRSLKGPWGWIHQSTRTECPNEECNGRLEKHFRTLRGRFQIGFYCDWCGTEYRRKQGKLVVKKRGFLWCD